MAILQTSDFKAEYAIVKDSFSDLQLYIDKYEKYYLLRMFGAELYALFIADLTLATPQVPQAAIYLNVFNAFQSDEDGWFRISEGIKSMLIQLIYFHFMREHAYEKTKSGVVTHQSELSTTNSYKGFNLIDSYNEGITNYKEIQWYIVDNLTVYPKFNGLDLTFASGI